MVEENQETSGEIFEREQRELKEREEEESIERQRQADADMEQTAEGAAEDADEDADEDGSDQECEHRGELDHRPDDNLPLVCDVRGCPGASHLGCCKPPLQRVPEEDVSICIEDFDSSCF